MSKTSGPHENIISTEFDGGEGVLVDLNTKRYYQLNETAMMVWRCLENGLTEAEIVRAMASTYEVAPEHAAVSVARLLQNLNAHKLISSHPTSE